MKRIDERKMVRIFFITALMAAVLVPVCMLRSADVGASEHAGDDAGSAEVLYDEVNRTTAGFVSSRYVRNVEVSPSKFMESAVYQDSYESELTALEKRLYAGYVNHFVTNRNTGSFTVTYGETFTFTADSYDSEADTVSDEDLAPVDDCVLSASAAFFYDHPEVFWIRSFTYRISFHVAEGMGYVDEIAIIGYASYANAYDDVNVLDSGLREAVESISAARSSDSRYDTLLAIHDYICENASYDYDAAASSNIYKFGYAYTAVPLFNGKGKLVCEGYAKAFKLLCREFDIPCVLVSGLGKASDISYGSHMWNYVQMENGKWYGVDTTWDDSSSSVVYTYFLVGADSVVFRGNTFGQDHIPDGQVMNYKTIYALTYPVLQDTMYYHYIVEEDSAIVLTTLGASIRLTEPYGIRYGVQLLKNDALQSVDVSEFGTLMIASGTLGNRKLTIDTPNALKIMADNIYSEDETQITYTGVLINIPKTFFDTKVKGRGYLIYCDGEGQEHIVYSEVVEKSFKGVAKAAYDTYSTLSQPNEEQQNIIGKLKNLLGNE